MKQIVAWIFVNWERAILDWMELLRGRGLRGLSGVLQRLDEGVKRLHQGFRQLDKGHKGQGRGLKRLSRCLKRLGRVPKRMNSGFERLGRGHRWLDRGRRRLGGGPWEAGRRLGRLGIKRLGEGALRGWVRP